jgi:hypothetical protein
MPLIAPKITETRKLYPDWLNDDDLRDGETDTISSSEEQFWIDLIEKYLKPYDMNEDSKVCHKQFLHFRNFYQFFALVILDFSKLSGAKHFLCDFEFPAKIWKISRVTRAKNLQKLRKSVKWILLIIP